MAGENERVTLSDGQVVEVRPPTAREYFGAQNVSERAEDQDASLICACALDEKGNQVFTPESAMELPLPDYMRVYRAVIRACRVDDEGAEKN